MTSTDLNAVMETLVNKAKFTDAVVGLIKEHGLLKPPKQRRRRRTKAEMAAAQAEARPRARRPVLANQDEE